MYEGRFVMIGTELISICNNCTDEISVVDFSAACIHSLQQLVNLLVGHLLAEIGQDVSELPNANESCHVFVEHLEASAVFFWLTRVAEPAGAVQNFGEGVEVKITAYAML